MWNSATCRKTIAVSVFPLTNESFALRGYIRDFLLHCSDPNWWLLVCTDDKFGMEVDIHFSECNSCLAALSVNSIQMNVQVVYTGKRALNYLFLQSNKLVILYLCFFLSKNVNDVFWSKITGKLCKVCHKICVGRYHRGMDNFTTSVIDDSHSVHLPGLSVL